MHTNGKKLKSPTDTDREAGGRKNGSGDQIDQIFEGWFSLYNLLFDVGSKLYVLLVQISDNSCTWRGGNFTW